MDKHKAAFLLKKNGATHLEIAKILQVNNSTVGDWNKKYKWEEILQRQQLFEETSLEQVQSLIDFNLKVLNAIKDRMLAQHNLETADIADLKKMLTDRGDVDALNKLYVNIRGKAIVWEQIVRIVRELTEHIDQEDNELAKKVTLYGNSFIEEKRKSS